MPSRDLKHAVPILQDAVPKIIADYDTAFPTRSLIVICVSRTAQEQFDAFKVGRRFALTEMKAPVAFSDWIPNENVSWEDWSVGKLKVVFTDTKKKITTLDGFKKFSKHNVSESRPLAEAVDFGVIINGKYMAGPKDTYLYHPLSDLAHKYGLICGGTDFPGWADWVHVETEGPFKCPR